MPEKTITGEKYWLKLAKSWQKVALPIKPGLGDVKIYEKFLHSAVKTRKKLKILVLGSTPEMRDLAAKYKAEVTVLDINWAMIQAMKRLLKYKNKDEILIKADWTKVPLKHNYYDVILGDGVIDNVSWPDSKKWWQHLYDLIKPTGVFITRDIVTVKDRNFCLQKFKKIMKSIIRKQKPTLIDLAALNISLELLSTNRKTQTCTDANHKKLYFKYTKNLNISESRKNKILKTMLGIYPIGKKVWRALSEPEVEKEIKLYFKILNKSFDFEGYFGDICPIYFLKRK